MADRIIWMGVAVAVVLLVCPEWTLGALGVSVTGLAWACGGIGEQNQ